MPAKILNSTDVISALNGWIESTRDHLDLCFETILKRREAGADQRFEDIESLARWSACAQVASRITRVLSHKNASDADLHEAITRIALDKLTQAGQAPNDKTGLAPVTNPTTADAWRSIYYICTL